jgi:hypothetical protein
MPQNRNKAPSKPPKVMTWAKAAPVLALSIIFYLLQQMFELFIFFGPAIAAVGCTLGANAVTGADLSGAGGKVTAVACTGIAGLAGIFGAAGFEGFGILMAIVVGFISWLTVGFVMVTTNFRIFTENASNGLKFLFGLLISEIPFIEMVPGLPIAVYRMYHAQIKKEKARLKAYEKARAQEEADARQNRSQEIAELQQAQAIRIAEERAQEAANEALDEEVLARQAANDVEYIPEERKEAA